MKSDNAAAVLFPMFPQFLSISFRCRRQRHSLNANSQRFSCAAAKTIKSFLIEVHGSFALSNFPCNVQPPAAFL